MAHDGYFTATAQYNDFNGTVAADRSDQHDIHKLLEEKGLVTDNEFLLSVQFYSSEGFVRCIAILLKDADRYETVVTALEKIPDPIPVKQVDLQLTPDEFLTLFKRFDVVLNHKGLPLEGRTFIKD